MSKSNKIPEYIKATVLILTLMDIINKSDISVSNGIIKIGDESDPEIEEEEYTLQALVQLSVDYLSSLSQEADRYTLTHKEPEPHTEADFYEQSNKPN